MQETRSIGLIGLGVMGQNLALNMTDHGFNVVSYDPWQSARSNFAKLNQDSANPERVTICDNLSDFIHSLPAPRSILLMVKAGEVVDQQIALLLPLLSNGDTIIDGGNSHYHDTRRREQYLQEKGLYFIGLGISGGEEGARRGPAMMAGGAVASFGRVQPIFAAIAARFEDEPCCALVGPDGAGHFVKMIHNGIEYGIMQLIAEAYVLLRDVGQLTHAEMSATFKSWNQTELASYLIEITADILVKPDEHSDHPLVEMILDKAGQKGTGRWSSEAALEVGIPTPTITSAVFARALSALKDERVVAAGILSGPDIQEAGSKEAFINGVREALLGSVIASYAQGLAVISAASAEHQWQVDIATVASIWRAGCIIRAELLDTITSAYRQSEQPLNLMCATGISDLLQSAQEGWRKTLVVAIESGIPVPAISSALAYYDSYRSPKLWANMIQAQRDYFGAHTYQRVDREGVFHSQW